MLQIWLLNWRLNLELASESSRDICLLNVASCRFGFSSCRFDFWIWIWSKKHFGLEEEVACRCQCWENSAGLFDRSNNAGAIDVKTYVSVLEEKSFFKCWGWLSFLNWIGALTLSVLLKLPPGKSELWSVLWSFVLLRLLFVSISCQGWSSRCYLEMLDKLQKWILNLFYSYFFGRC